MKPKLDTRFGTQDVSSRAGLSKRADLLLTEDSVLDLETLKGKDCILVDEAQFLSKAVIDQFRLISTVHNIPVICYGLRTDFRGELFEGSKRLFEVADSLEEIKTTLTSLVKNCDGKGGVSDCNILKALSTNEEHNHLGETSSC